MPASDPSAANRPLLIGITGGSGSGKTTFIEQLRANFSAEEVCIISQDDYYRPRTEQRVDAQGVTNFDLPRAIDKKAFRRDIERLRRGETVTREEYTFNNAEKAPRLLTFRPAPVIIAEGLFVFHYKKIKRLIDLKVFLDAKENLKVIRRIRRDRVERNYPLDDVLYRYEHHVLPTFEQYIGPYRAEADIVINNNQKGFDMGLAVLVGFVQQRVK